MAESERRKDALNQRLAIATLTCTVFFGAMLLFSMEPLFGRLLTPYFGGAAHVWLTCLMFFQAMLLLGYLYAHLLVRKVGVLHLLFLLIPLISLPLRIGATPDPDAPVPAVLVTLFFHAALPFIALSTTAVVAQAWLANSSVGRDKEPYPLYAASNAGSLLALLGYAFLVEPFSSLRVQSLMWSGAYAVYVFLVLVSWFLLKPGKESRENPARAVSTAPPPLTRSVYLQWLFLSALPSAFLLATTNYITLEVGSFPFIWVIPLALYLGSFIVTFRAGGGVPGSLNVLWIEVLLLGSMLYFLGVTGSIGIIINQCIFFAICIIAHGNLYNRRPPVRYLTHFYLTSALGGWIGGILISLVAPFLFNGLFEYPILLFFFGITFWWCHHNDFFRFWRHVTLKEGSFRVLLLTSMVVVLATMGYKSYAEPTIYRHRNFYGAYRVQDEPGNSNIPGGIRTLLHGRTIHGSQLLHPDQSSVLTHYYCAGSGISDAIETADSPRRVGVIGLGCGVVSTYLNTNDAITYFEIDPDIENIARRWFTYLDDSKGKVEIFFGDGRLLMQKGENSTKEYDVILVDAFTGDGIPTHLLTREAIEIYLRRLSQNGVIVFHISNRYYDLRPVLKATASDLNLLGAMKNSNQTSLEPYQAHATCVAVTRSPGRLESLLNRNWQQLEQGDGLKEAKGWTDDHINILSSFNKWSDEPVMAAAVLKQKFKDYWAEYLAR